MVFLTLAAELVQPMQSKISSILVNGINGRFTTLICAIFVFLSAETMSFSVSSGLHLTIVNGSSLAVDFPCTSTAQLCSKSIFCESRTLQSLSLIRRFCSSCARNQATCTLSECGISHWSLAYSWSCQPRLAVSPVRRTETDPKFTPSAEKCCTSDHFIELFGPGEVGNVDNCSDG